MRSLAVASLLSLLSVVFAGVGLPTPCYAQDTETSTDSPTVEEVRDALSKDRNVLPPGEGADRPGDVPRGALLPPGEGAERPGRAPDGMVLPPSGEASEPAEKEPDTVKSMMEGKDQTGNPPPPPRESQSPEESAAPGEDRPLPNYDGREGAGTGAGDGLIWIPRVIFFPVHLTLNYLVRWPLVGGLTWAEKNYAFARIENWLTFRDGKSGVFPSFFADFGLRPSVGLTTFHNDFPVDDNHLTVTASFWDAWIRIAGQNQTIVFDDDSGELILEGEYMSRPDNPFYGIGSLTATDEEQFYRETSWQFGFRFTAALWKLNRLWVGTHFRNKDFNGNGLGPRIGTLGVDLDGDGVTDPAEPRLTDRTQIPGFEGYQLVDVSGGLKLDTRDPDTQFGSGTGLLFEAFASFEFDPTDTGRNFLRWGSEAGAFVDLGAAHVLALRVYGEFVERTGGQEVPFTELPALGGLESMRGYLPRRFIGESTFMITGSYRYPIWSLIDAELFTSLGNAFDGHYRDFSFRRMYWNGGLGLRTNLDRDLALSVIIAGGTNRLDTPPIPSDPTGDPGLTVDSFRFTLGVARGF